MDSTASAVVTALVETGNIDTVYRDVYLDRARSVLAPLLSLEAFHRFEQERAALAELPLTIARALDNANWSLVKQLSERAQTLSHALDDKAALLAQTRDLAGHVRVNRDAPVHAAGGEVQSARLGGPVHLRHDLRAADRPGPLGTHDRLATREGEAATSVRVEHVDITARRVPRQHPTGVEADHATAAPDWSFLQSRRARRRRHDRHIECPFVRIAGIGTTPPGGPVGLIISHYC